ncbi:dTMP kinase [Actinomadura madurae]|uniref:dTMP kinase n=1 Tax=Actinomadura madurae TaxID=1993 RepID=UPI003FD6D1EB
MIAAALALAVLALVQNLVVVVFMTAFLGVFAGAAWSNAKAAVNDPDAPEDTRPSAYLRSVALVTVLLAAVAVPLIAGAVGSHRIDLGGGVYDVHGSGVALLVAAVVALVSGLLAYRRLDDRRGIPLVPDLRAALHGEIYTPPEQAAAAPQQPVHRNRGVFIAFEGGEGAGKTTQARLAAIWLRDHGYDVVTTHEPGATKIGMRLRAMLLDRDTTGLSVRGETLLYAADRADHVANVIKPGDGPRRDRGQRPLRRLVPGLPGVRPAAGRGGHRPRQRVGDRRSRPGPDRPAGDPAADGPRPAAGPRRPDGVGVGGLPRARPRRVPRPRRGRPGPLPDPGREPPAGRADPRDPVPDPRDPARPDPGGHRGRHEHVPGHHRLLTRLASLP